MNIVGFGHKVMTAPGFLWSVQVENIDSMGWFQGSDVSTLETPCRRGNSVGNILRRDMVGSDSRLLSRKVDLTSVIHFATHN